MPNTLDQYLLAPPPKLECGLSLTLTNTLTHPADPTSNISITLTIDEGLTVSEPQIEVSITHA